MQFISDSVREAVIGVFDTMMSLRLKALDVAEGAALPPPAAAGIVGSVGMAGKINGTVYMSYPSPLACHIVEKLIGVSPSSVEQPEVTDVIGELANMVAGDLKRRTSEKGYHGLLVPPVVMLGSGINIDSHGAPISIYRSFQVPNSPEPLAVRFFAKLEG